MADDNVMQALLRELKEDFREHRQDFHDHSTETHSRMTNIEKDLREHKEGVIQNRGRIERLEEPRKLLKLLKDWAGWIIAIAAAVSIISGKL